MSDIVGRLRCGEPCLEASGINECRVKDAASGCLCAMAADEIERLRAALQDLLRLVDEEYDSEEAPPYVVDQVLDRARAALEEKPHD